ncbi:MAG: hypothetical protein Q8P67_22690, partial [archaeon]|nr:hypothetical protein [archaeon]
VCSNSKKRNEATHIFSCFLFDLLLSLIDCYLMIVYFCGHLFFSCSKVVEKEQDPSIPEQSQRWIQANHLFFSLIA